jgi:hypothetical protein
MMITHPSGMELQEYALDKSGCSTETTAHIQNCENCQAVIANYHSLFAGIKEQPRPLFDFDLSSLVLEQLPGALIGKQETPITEKVRFGLSGWLMSVIICCTIAVSLYLFRKNIWNMFSEIPGYFLYLVLASAVVIVLLRIMDMYRKYQKQIDVLNFY